MDLHDDGEVSRLPHQASRSGKITGSIYSLNEAWVHTLDRCVIEPPLSEVIVPLMYNCFFGGAMHAVLLLQNGHSDKLASDIAAFIMKEPQS
jgi:hypothetical protein